MHRQTGQTQNGVRRNFFEPQKKIPLKKILHQSFKKTEEEKFLNFKKFF